MSKYILDASGNQITGIAVWDQKDRYPVVSAGTKDPAQVALETGQQIGTLNGNWIRFRNYVNDLRSRIDNIASSIPDASATTGGKVNIVPQIFAGLKTFINGITVGNSTTAGQVNFDSPVGFTSVLKSSHTNPQALFLPDKSGTLATIGDVNTADGNLATHKGGTDHDGRYYTETEIDTKLGALAGTGLKKNADGTYSPNVDGSTILLTGGKLTTAKKDTFTIHFSYNAGDRYATIAGRLTSQMTGAPMVRSGRVTNLVIVDENGIDITEKTGSVTFAAKSRITFGHDGTGIFGIYINGVGGTGFPLFEHGNVESGGDTMAFGTIYGEYD